MNTLMMEAHGKWSFLQVCHLWKAKGRLFLVPSTSVPNLGIFDWRPWNLGSPGTIPRNWVRDYVFNSYYEDKK